MAREWQSSVLYEKRQLFNCDRRKYGLDDVVFVAEMEITRFINGSVIDCA